MLLVLPQDEMHCSEQDIQCLCNRRGTEIAGLILEIGTKPKGHNEKLPDHKSGLRGPERKGEDA